MPDPDPGSGVSPGLYATLRSFWSVIVAILYTRLDLVTAELEDEVTRGVRMLIAGVVGVIGLMFSFFFAMYFLIAMFWDTHYRLWVIGGVFAVYFVIGLIGANVARNLVLNRPRFLSQTLAELKRDVESLKSAVAAKRDEPKP